VVDRWDDVVVGAGTAGCCVARRLADAGRRVLLLEAGPDRPAPPAVRGLDAFAAMAEPGWTWDDLTARRHPDAPDTPYLRGRGVGGSSAVNALIAMVGQRDDYDRWAREHGCVGWSWADLQPAFQRAWAALRPTRRPAGPVADAVGRAAVDGGHARAGGTGDWDRLGYLAADLTVRDDQRWTAADAYLDGAPPGLVVRAGRPVARVVLDGARAAGVELDDGSLVEAGRVVLCAGAVHSPALLARSGVRRPDLGRQALDHPAVALTLTRHDERRPDPPVTHLLRFSSGFAGGRGDLQLLPSEHLGAGAPGLAMVGVALMAVRSRGRVLAPDGTPRLELATSGDELDLRRLAAGLRHAVALLASPEVAAVASSVAGPDGTPAPDLAAATDDELVGWLPAHLGAYVHLVGTCRTGPPGDEDRVVDLDGAVVGHPGLYVIDASVLPDLPSATTHLPVLAVAEHLAGRLAAAVWVVGAGG
jgi:5-(hydroxymethyl)furfural/furfural oxidase